jgi:hypothetical protein
MTITDVVTNERGLFVNYTISSTDAAAVVNSTKKLQLQLGFPCNDLSIETIEYDFIDYLDQAEYGAAMKWISAGGKVLKYDQGKYTILLQTTSMSINATYYLIKEWLHIPVILRDGLFRVQMYIIDTAGVMSLPSTIFNCFNMQHLCMKIANLSNTLEYGDHKQLTDLCYLKLKYESIIEALNHHSLDKANFIINTIAS